MARRGKSITWCAAGITGLVVVAGVIATRDLLLAEWMILQLGSRNAETRDAAIVGLGKLRSTRAVPRLTEIFRSESAYSSPPSHRLGPTRLSGVPWHRYEPSVTGAALVSIGSPGAEGLLSLVHDGNDSVVDSALGTLDLFGPEIVPALLKYLDGSDNRSDLFALKRLKEELFKTPARLDPPAALAVRSALRHRNITVRVIAAKAVGKRLVPCLEGAIPELVRLLDDPEWRVREAALIGLSYAGSSAAAVDPSIIAMLDDAQEEVRAAAVNALAEIGITRGEIPGVARALAREGMETEAIADLLATLGAAAKAAVPDLAKALLTAHGRNQIAIANALKKIGPDASESAPALVQSLARCREDGIRAAVIEAISSIGPAATPAWTAAMKDPLTRNDVVRGLVELGPTNQDAVALLVDVLRDREGRDAATLGCVVEGLGRIGKAAAPAVLELAALVEKSGEAPAIRRLALEALGKICPAAQAVLPAILKALDDPDGELGSAAAIALVRLGAPDASIVASIVPSLERVHERGNLAGDVRAGVALELLHLGSASPGLHEEVARALSSRATAARVIEALKDLPNEAARFVTELTNHLRGDEDRLVIEAAGILQRLGPDAYAALPALRSALALRESEPEGQSLSLASSSDRAASNADVRRSLARAIASIEESVDGSDLGRIREERLKAFEAARRARTTAHPDARDP